MKLQTQLCLNMLNQNVPYTNTKWQNMWKIENNPKLILPKSFFGPREPKFALKNLNEICTTKITFRTTHKTQKPPTRPFCASRVWRSRRENKKVLVFQHVHLIWLTRSKVQASQGSNQPWNLTLHCIAQRAQIISESLFFLFISSICIFKRYACNLFHDRNRAHCLDVNLMTKRQAISTDAFQAQIT